MSLDGLSPAGVVRRGVVELCRYRRWPVLLVMLLVPALTLARAAAAEAATLRVNTTKDEMTSGDGRCSLREAIDAANHPGTKTDCGRADNTSNLIVLGAKTYKLSIPPAPGDSDQNCIAGTTPPDQNASGDLCVTSNAGLTITGQGPSTIIEGVPSLTDRLMTIAPQASVALAALSMEGGRAPDGNTAGNKGANGVAGGIFVQASKAADNLTLENTIVDSSVGLNCSPSAAFTNGGHNLNFPSSDTSCPAAVHGNPKLKAFADYGGYTGTLALAPGSAAINQVPRMGAGCPATDQRTVRRPQGPACDIGAFEFARPKIEIDTPRNAARYRRGSRVLAFFICREGTVAPAPSPIKACVGTVANGKRVNTSSLGVKSFKVTATDKEGDKASETVHYTVVR